MKDCNRPAYRDGFFVYYNNKNNIKTLQFFLIVY